MRYGLTERTISDLNEVFHSFDDISGVILYGSRAKGDFHEGSDIDFAVIGKDIDLSLLHEVELAIDELCLPYEIDLTNYHTLENRDLISHIDRVGKLFFQR